MAKKFRPATAPQKTKKDWEQFTHRDPPSISSRPLKTSSPKLYPNAKPMLTQERSMGKHRPRRDMGFDPWASPTNLADAEELFQDTGTRAGIPRDRTSYHIENPSNPVHIHRNPDPSPSLSRSPQRQISHQTLSRSAIKHRQSYQQMQQHHSNRSNNVQHSRQTKHIIPGVSQMTMRQILSVVFSAFWDRADLYTDVLGLEHDQATPRQLKLAFLRQGRVVLATPIESPDDMTLLSAGIRGMITSSSNSDAISTVSVVQSGTPVSRKAKLRFQAVSLAYELLKDGDKRKARRQKEEAGARGVGGQHDAAPFVSDPQVWGTGGGEREGRRYDGALQGDGNRLHPEGGPGLGFPPCASRSIWHYKYIIYCINEF